MEFGFYLAVTIGLIYLFTIWHNVPERNIIISVDKDGQVGSCNHDSILRVSTDILLQIPMTNRVINYEGGFRTTIRVQKDSISKDDYHERIHWKVHKSSINSDLGNVIEKIRYSNNYYLKDSLEKYVSNNNNLNTFVYFSIYYNRGPGGIRKPLEYRYQPIVGTDNDTTFSFSESHFPSDHYESKVIYAIKKKVDTINTNSDGDVLGRPVWYRLEDISQSYYNIRFNSRMMDSLSLEIDFKGAVDFSNMQPEPDEMRMGSIKFYDPDKINQIEIYGLQFHAKFRELENMQTVRLFAVTTILGGILIIFVGLLFVGIYHMGKVWKRHKFTVSLILIILVLLALYYFNGLSYIYYTFISN